MKSIGGFNIATGLIIVSDPCYEEYELPFKAKRGEWHARIELSRGWGERVATLTAECLYRGPSQRTVQIERGVDSGQMGIFDSWFYRNDDDVPLTWQPAETAGWQGHPRWYQYCCDHTLSTRQAGVLPHGVVSSSGYGDGSYTVELDYNGDEVVAVRAHFITEEEEGDDV